MVAHRGSLPSLRPSVKTLGSITFQRKPTEKPGSCSKLFDPLEHHICSSLKERKKQREKSIQILVLRFPPSCSYQADTNRKITETITEHPFPCVRREIQLLVGEISPAPFNYESRREAWKIPASLQPRVGGGGRQALWVLEELTVRDEGWRVVRAKSGSCLLSRARMGRVGMGASETLELYLRSSQQAFLGMAAPCGRSRGSRAWFMGHPHR